MFTGMYRIASGVSVIGAIIGELFAGSSRVGVGGLGYAIQYASAAGDRLSVCAGLRGVALGFAFFFRRDVSGVVFSS
jgi:NitT/TauT family transport system permease protein